MRCPPDSKFTAICTLEGTKGGGGGPEEDLYRLQRRDRQTVPEAIIRGVGQQVSIYLKILESQLGRASTFCKYSPEIRKLIYTTNPIESFNRSLRKVTKTRTLFSNEDAFLNLAFLAIQDIEKKRIKKFVTVEKSTPNWLSILRNGLRSIYNAESFHSYLSSNK